MHDLEMCGYYSHESQTWNLFFLTHTSFKKFEIVEYLSEYIDLGNKLE